MFEDVYDSDAASESGEGFFEVRLGYRFLDAKFQA